MQNNEVKESIWADGCPENVSDEFILDKNQLIGMGINYIINEFAIPNGFKIEACKAKIGVFPNLVLKRNDKIYAIAVVPFVFPDYSYINDEYRLKMVEYVKGYNGIPYMAPIGFMSVDQERALASMALKGDIFKTSFKGFIKLTDEEHQELEIVEGKFTLLNEE